MHSSHFTVGLPQSQSDAHNPGNSLGVYPVLTFKYSARQFFLYWAIAIATGRRALCWIPRYLLVICFNIIPKDRDTCRKIAQSGVGNLYTRKEILNILVGYC